MTCNDGRARILRLGLREIRFVPGTQKPVITAIAVTSGCCYQDPTTGQEDPTKDQSRVLTYDGGAPVGTKRSQPGMHFYAYPTNVGSRTCARPRRVRAA